MVVNKVAIIGLGLIGGSLARALHERLGISDITAVNRSIDSIEQAVRDGAITRGYTEPNEYVWDADLVFICTPVKRAIEYIAALSGRVKPGCIITDVGSTKAEINEYVDSMLNPPVFIGGHPMAGTEKTGYSAGFAHLFENAYYVLTPGKNADAGSMDTMLEVVKGIGAIPVVMDARVHDRITGSISHVPHIIASALVNLVRDLDSPEGEMQMLAAGGFKDITRIASSSPEMWENIVSSNGEQVSQILGAYIQQLLKVKGYIDGNDRSSIYDFFKSAKSYRDTFSTAPKGLIPPLNEIVVDVVDKPGIIGEIATILGENGINIKNINVSNSREFEQGCLRITLSDPSSANIAFDLLSCKGYKVYKCI